MLDSVLTILPLSIRRLICSLAPEILAKTEEIRIRESRPLEITMYGNYFFVASSGKLGHDATAAYQVSKDDCLQLLDLLTNHSVYTLEEQLKRGYITVRGGHRVGLSGKTILDQGTVKQLREISSFNVRIAKEIVGAAEPLFPQIVDFSAGTIHQTLIVSRPQQGKTTLVRDFARLISSGNWNVPGFPNKSLKVGIVDERSEIAAVYKGVPGFDVGPRTDILDSCPKAEGMMMMIRGMSPDVMIVDEIGRPEDAAALHEALHAGIRVIATAHGHSFEDLQQRPMLKQLMQEQIFARYIMLGQSYGLGRVHRIYDAAGRMVESMIIRNGNPDA